MGEQLNRRRFLGAAVAAAAAGPLAAARQVMPREKTVDPVQLPLDKPGVWTLHFRYKTPKIETIPLYDNVKKERVTKRVWYLWYQVWNTSGEPVYFIPAFELVPKDVMVGSIMDDPQPYIVDWLARNREDEPGVQDIQTSISISKRAVPPTKPDAVPRTVSGIAVWTDLEKKAPRMNKFSIYVSGLSNGLVKEEQIVPPDNRTLTIIRRKALRLDFFMPTDGVNPRPEDIRPDTSSGPAETWVYRSSSEIGQPAPPGAAAPPKKGPID